MAFQTMKVTTKPARLVTVREAADYCRLPQRKFEAQCPAKPIIFETGEKRYDLHDIDPWLDGLKADGMAHSQDEILGKLE